MVATLFLLLFFLGLLLSTIGNIVGIVDAFRVNTTWGLLALFVPFALLVYCIKFWNRKWARNSLLMGLGGLALSMISLPLTIGSLVRMAGRQAQQDFDQGLVIEGQPTEGEAPAEGTAPQPSKEGDDLFKESFLPGLPSAAQIALAELLPSTDATERLKEINVNRPDPFSVVQVPVPPKPAPPAPPKQPAPKSPSGTVPGTGTGVGSPTLPSGFQPGTTGAGNGPSASGGATNTSGTRPGGATSTNAGGARPGGATSTNAGGARPGGATSTNAGGTRPGGATSTNAGGAKPGGGSSTPETPGTIKPLPELPNPVATASKVQVTGVAKVNGDNYAIVRAPGDPTSRYVKVGDRVANGAVLVKRIDTTPGKDPVVVLEERGVEVTLPVGSNVGPSEADTEEKAEKAAIQNPNAIASIPFLP